ncbi:fatty acyl-CoA reductase wat-like [Haematobia irritans]|uniref:fatty acyl-CoA reductase wat-like n=1 Tax=Haematobia irritans TaxID=7368 RepID=UPI003F502B0A
MSISQFYKDKDIFITGGTGFIGKVLIEKILRSLPHIGKVYVLIRAKHKKDCNERLNEILALPLFRRVRAEQPQSLEKIYAISGDCQEIGLGISSCDLKKIQNVAVIFHVAATVRFDEKFKTSILLNTRGTHELVKIAQDLTQLQAFMHVSTTYAHPQKDIVDEMFYFPDVDWRNVIKMAETFDAETLNILFPKFATNHPNTYTFTKCLAEHIIYDYRHKLPGSIFRPSIVVSSHEEPFPGWIDNINGPIGMLVACGTGIMRTEYADPNVVPDIIPVDMCSNSLLVSAYKIASSKHLSDELKDRKDLDVFNCCNSSKSFLTTNDIVNIGKQVIKDIPFEKCIWLPEGSITACPVWHYWRLITMQIIPAIFLDALLYLARKPTFLMRINRRIVSTTSILDTFMNKTWTFKNENFKSLENLLDDTERSKFKFLGYSDCDMIQFYRNCASGVREFLLNENPIPSQGAHMRMRVFYILHYVIQFYGAFYIVRYLLKSSFSQVFAQ